MGITSVLSRRSFMKLAFVAACTVPADVALAGCASSNAGPKTSTVPSTNNAASPAAGSVDGRILVAYFSGTGHTERVAQIVAEELGADVFVITPVEPYTRDDLNYNNEASRVCQEHDDPSRHVELEVVTPEGFDEYATVLVGYPVWWQHASWVLDDFVSQNDFEGKTVIPFCTSASSPLGESASDLAAMAQAGDWQEGVRFSSGVGEDEVRAWVGALQL